MKRILSVMLIMFPSIALAHPGHGSEMVGNGVMFGAAMLTTAALLHGAGLALGLSLNRISLRIARAVAFAGGLSLAFAG